MFQHNQEVDAQFNREIGIIITEILISCENLRPTIDEFTSRYRPRNCEESGWSFSMKLDLPDAERFLCELMMIEITDESDFHPSIQPLKDMAINVVNHMICINVIIGDIIKMYFETIENEISIHLYFIMVNHLLNSISSLSIELNKLYTETSLRCPGLLVQEESVDLAEEAVFPEELEGFCFMKSALLEAFSKYLNENKPGNTYKFYDAINNYLEKFGRGINSDGGFRFSFGCRTDFQGYGGSEYVDFNFESEYIEVSSGGSVYDPDVGSDSFTNWTYNIWLDGYENYNYHCDFDKVIELVCDGAKLDIDNPEEYVIDEND